MEVTPQPAAPPTTQTHMRDYWPRYRKKMYIIITAVQCLCMLVVFSALELFGVTQLTWYGVFLWAFAVALLLNTITITLIHVFGKPFRDLVQAVVLAAGEPSTEAPANPNTPAYEKDGFRDILQTVYELAARGEATTTEGGQLSSDVVLSTGMDNTSTGVIILDANHSIVYSNHAAPVRTDTRGGLVIDLLFAEDDTLEQWLEKAEKSKLTAEHQWTRIADKLPGEKGRRFFDIAASYHKGSNAETIITLYDRTGDYMPEEDELDFISFAAHELRGPITVIRGYLDVLHEELHPVLERDQAELMERLIVTSNRLSSYVNNILNAAKYDRKHLRLHLSEERITDIYKTISDDMQLRASAQNRLLVIDIPDTLPTVAADNNAVGEVLGNLIDNAIKYSNEGGLVHVTAHATPGFVEVAVIDRGIGIPVSVMPNLFHKFYRSHRSRETIAGTGIGLYISKAIVSSHGGTITARSVENEGSTFSFTLPIYDSVADKLKSGSSNNQSLIEHGSGWIRNHSLYRG